MENKQMDYCPLWNRYLDMFEDAELTEQQIGALVMAMMRFQARGELPRELDPMCKVFWSVIHQDLQRARQRYDTAVANGKKGGRPRKIKPEETEKNPEKGITKTESKSKSESKTESKSTTETETTPDAEPAEKGSAPAEAAGICCDAQHVEESDVQERDPPTMAPDQDPYCLPCAVKGERFPQMDVQRNNATLSERNAPEKAERVPALGGSTWSAIWRRRRMVPI